jgi:DNA-binding CsgD family transcriptional regulator
MLREAQGLEHRDANDYYRNEIQHTLAEVFRDLGQADSSFWYMDQYVQLHDELEEIAASNRAEIVHLELVNQEGVHKLLTLNKDKHRIAIIRNFTIILIIVLTALGFLYINRLKLKSRIRQQQALEQQRLAETKAKNAIDQLNAFTENLVEKTKLVENLQSRLLEKELNEEQIQQIQELSHYSILTDADWEQFKSLFTTVYPGFFIELKRKVNDITLAEQRMAALLKLQVSNKDAATMLGISINSVHKTRQRLRQRLGFEQDAELETYFTVVSTALNDRDFS